MASDETDNERLSLQQLKGVGPRTLDNLARLHLHTIPDLLFHLPIRYEDRTRITPMADLRPGDRVLLQGEIVKTRVIPGRKTSLVVQLSDDSGTITLRFFHFTAAQRQRLMTMGLRLWCFGEVRAHYRAGFEMVHPEYRPLHEDTVMALSERLTAVYPTTKGLQQRTFRQLMVQAFAKASSDAMLEELLPEAFLTSMHYPSLYEALDYVHYPPPDAQLTQLEKGQHPAQQRLAFEELLAHHLSLRQMRQHAQQDKAPILLLSERVKPQLLASLAFQLTAAQQRVATEIEQDLMQPQPMMRLVQGDVGSGKTIVAAAAVAQAVEAGFQAAVMAPTEILAEQHYQQFQHWFAPLGLSVGWLSGQLTMAQRRPVLAGLLQGDIDILVGTHAIFQQEVQFQKLALLVVDEQHRFGVQQRMALREKGVLPGQQPHQLIMTATPIPRTLAMTAYADLDCSLIDELPPGRQPITTILVSNQRREEVIERVRSNAAAGHQAYWVCTLIEESETLQCQAAEAAAVDLKVFLTDMRVDLIHGRIKADEKERIMARFKQGEIDLLVATTVVEVGVDVPQANLMVIENPERLGLAQLHQLRGRVGRSDIQSYCVLLYQSPLSTSTQQRLGIIRHTQDGFKIAEADLAIRGPGEVLGTRQAGLLSFRVADVVRDQHLLVKVKTMGAELQKNQPKNAENMVQRWIGDRHHYFHI